MDKLDSILLVDDDSTQNFINERLIRRLEVAQDLHVAQNGLDALELIRKLCLEPVNQKHLPDLILLDINMPVLNGFGFLKAFEQLNCPGKEDVVIVVLTTSTNPHDLETIRQAGIKDFINKPLTKNVITELINKYFEQ